jgi:formate hydrogenlyase subunit 4
MQETKELYHHEVSLAELPNVFAVMNHSCPMISTMNTLPVDFELRLDKSN